MNEADKIGNKEMYNIYNSTQNAIKISLNSIYGFLGRSTGNLTLRQLGSIVTYYGRTLINNSKNYVEEEFVKYMNSEQNCPKYKICI
jgi:DNA polymerase elongation subunit (family B)